MTLKNKFAFTLLITSIACFAQEQLRIKGNIKGLSDAVQLSIIDSKNNVSNVEITNGAFDVQMVLPESPSLILLDVQDGNENNRYTVFAGNESINVIDTVRVDLPFIQTKGSQYDGVRYQYDVFMKEIKEEANKIYDETDQYFISGEMMTNDSLSKSFYSDVEPFGKVVVARKKVEAREFEFLKKNINTDFGRYKLEYITNAYTDEQNRELLALVDPIYQSTKEVEYLKTLVEYKELENGDKYYDFLAKDINGNQVNFSQYFDGKYVLLDLTTIHCGASQMAAPKNTESAEKLANKINFVTYYIDNNEEFIQMFYEMKQNKGILIWDERGRIAPALAKYRLSGTPNYYLFDPNGNLIERIGGYSPEFENNLLKLIN